MDNRSIRLFGTLVHFDENALPVMHGDMSANTFHTYEALVVGQNGYGVMLACSNISIPGLKIAGGKLDEADFAQSTFMTLVYEKNRSGHFVAANREVIGKVAALMVQQNLPSSPWLALTVREVEGLLTVLSLMPEKNAEISLKDPRKIYCIDGKGHNMGAKPLLPQQG